MIFSLKSCLSHEPEEEEVEEERVERKRDKGRIERARLLLDTETRGAVTGRRVGGE